MTTLLLPHEATLIFYRDLAARLGADRPAGETLREAVHGALKTCPLTLGEVERVRREAEDWIWSAPRQSWGLAQIAHIAAHDFHNDFLSAECELTLGISLNALGEYADAIPILERATERFLANNCLIRAARCQCEIAALYADMGKLAQTEKTLTTVRTLVMSGDPLLGAYYDRAEGLLHFEQNRYPEAIDALRRAAETFAAGNRVGEMASTWCKLAEVLRYLNPQEAIVWIEQARGILTLNKEPLHLARCDYSLALIYEQQNRYTEGLRLVRRARSVFAGEGMAHFVALCDLLQGLIHYDRDQFDKALRAYTRAQSVFASQSLESHAARCDLNTAIIYYVLDRNSEALALYERVAKSAVAEGRILRAAICYTNIGLCYDHLGRYDRALGSHQRAYYMLLRMGSVVLAARCQENLAGTYRRLGRYSQALQHCQQEYDILIQHGLPVDIANCDSYTADIHMALGNYAQAAACLGRAHTAYEQAGMPIRLAICERELARALTKTAQVDQAHHLLNNARITLMQHNLVVDAILCDVAQGESYLYQQQVPEAEALFKSALVTLAPGFPEGVWRIEVGLGQCALLHGDQQAALGHWLRAVTLTSQTRATLPTERLSGSFFADRQVLYDQALRLALDLGQASTALMIVEAAKAQAYLGWPTHRSWREQPHDDPYLQELFTREAQLGRQLMVLRDQLRVDQVGADKPLLRTGDEACQDPRPGLEKLTQLSHDYEDIVEQLRIQAPLQMGAYALTPLSVQAFRQVAQQHLPAHWACLAYYWLDDQLVIFYLDAEGVLIPTVKSLSSYERKVLDQCTNPDKDFREIIYGDRVSSYTQLSCLYQLLIPPQARTLRRDDLLIIAPHARLHALPFHALQDSAGPLGGRVPIVVVPSLGALEMMLHTVADTRSIDQVLALGLADFGTQARPLPSSRHEINTLAEVFGERLKSLWDMQATPEILNQLGQTGELAKYDIIHFATHAVLDNLAPSQSRVLLYNGNLAYSDILNLKLRARLVVLASCEGALGYQYAGDEAVGLAQAFFFAGASAVVASLWPVEDVATAELMRRFYRQLDTTNNIAQALCVAQSEMALAGYTPYQWAPFIVIGLP